MGWLCGWIRVIWAREDSAAITKLGRLFKWKIEFKELITMFKRTVIYKPKDMKILLSEELMMGWSQNTNMV